ncbi:MFS family permease [Catenulispora sp. GP43]|uniref:MFS transporter n=1 Tax=Catenulispora sp. GP43 TaxID=3156263 RepID=UPI003519B772
MTGPETTSLLRDRDFVLFAGGQGVSALGDALSKTALPLLVLALTGSGLQVGVIAMLSVLPSLVLGLPAGAWADRLDRRRMMLWSDVGRTLLVGLAPLAALLGIPVLPVLYAITVPVGVLYAVFEGACLSCVPSLVGRDRIGEANSLLGVGNALGYLIGPAVAGVLVAAVGGAAALGVDAASFAASALTLALLRNPLRTPVEQEPAPMTEQLRAGFRYIASQRLLRSTLIYWSAIAFLTAPVVICATYFVRQDLGWSPRIIGVVIATYAFGAIIGAVLAPRLSRTPGTVMVGSTMVASVGLLVLSATARMSLAFGIALVVGVGEGLSATLYTTLRAQLVPGELLGRVAAAAQVAMLGLRPLSVFLAGVALEATSGSVTLAAIGVSCLVVSVVFAVRSPILFAAAPALR